MCCVNVLKAIRYKQNLVKMSRCLLGRATVNRYDRGSAEVSKFG